MLKRAVTDIAIFAVVLVVFFGLLALIVSTSAKAEGSEYLADTTPTVDFSCSYPLTRTDGTPFLPEDYGFVDLFIVDSPNAEAEPYYSGPLCGATVSIAAMISGQKYRYWRMWDSEGRYSDKSATVPFYVWNVPPPNPPTDTTIN